jgi:hypothetical protein
MATHDTGTGREEEAEVALRWIECIECKGWELFENSGLSKSLDAKAIKKLKYVCRVCKIIKQLNSVVHEIST